MFQRFIRPFVPLCSAVLFVLLPLLANAAPTTTQTSVPGTVVAWGDNEYGQTDVPSDLNDATAITAGPYHSMALKQDGTVVAWGYNNGGQTTVPAGLRDVTAVAAGDYYSLALKQDGTVVAWGDNSYRQTTVPAGLRDVTAIAAGRIHNLALKQDSTVVAWGSDGYGQTDVPSGLRDVIAIAAGAYHSLALKRDGTVVAWGWNDYGQTNVPSGLRDVIAIAARDYHNLALKQDGTVVAWGDNYYGQLNVPAGLRDVTAIAAGGYHSLALKGDGTVVAWGYKISGQTTVPAGLRDVTAIAAGAYHSLAIGTLFPTVTVSFTPNGQKGWFTTNPATGSVTAQGGYAITSIICTGATVSNPQGIGTTSASATLTVSGEGSHDVSCSATGSAGQSGFAEGSPHTATVKIDSIAPQTTITSRPPIYSSATATFTFSGSDTGGSGVDNFQCTFDGSSFGACTSPQSYSGLSDGTHIFQVRAVDEAGTSDPTPANYSWKVDTIAPNTTIGSRPATTTTNTSATFTFSGSDTNGVASFQCALDDSAFTTCTNPQSYSGLTVGSHTFQVRAIDGAGNVDPTPASYTWQIDAPPATATATATATDTPVPPTATATATDTPLPTATATSTNTPVPPTATATDTPLPPTNTATATDTPVPPTATATSTNTPMPPTATATATSTSTPVPPTATATSTNTPVPPTATATATSTPVPPTATATATATSTSTPVPPTATATSTSEPPTNTALPTNMPTNTATNTPLPTNTALPTSTSTNTPLPTSTTTNTPVPPTNTTLPTATSTNTPLPTATRTSTPVPPTATRTSTPVPPTATRTATATPTVTSTSTPVPPTVTPTSGPNSGSILDTFNRATGKVGSNWGGLTSDSFYRIGSNQLDVEAGGPLIWKPASFGTSQEAFVTLSTIDPKSPSQGVLLKVQTDSVADAGAISVVYDAVAKGVRVSTLRVGTNGAWTLYASKAATFASGDVLKARALSNGTVQIFKNGTLVTTVTLNAADSTFFNNKGGRIGIWSTLAPKAVLDDFGGGTVTSSSTARAMAASDTPDLTVRYQVFLPIIRR